MQTIRQAVTTVIVSDLNPISLASETDMFRNTHVSAMTDLFRRSSVARPIPRSVSKGDPGSTRTRQRGGTTAPGCWCQQMLASPGFKCAFCGSEGGGTLSS